VKFSNTIKSILGMYFIKKDVELDLKQGTDFTVFTLNPITVAVRLRTFDYYLRYPDEFTIRWSRPSGVITEIHKIRLGLVNYIFYGFVDKSERNLIKYFIGDLTVFRQFEPKPFIKQNKNGDSELAAFKISDLPDVFILHKYEALAKQLLYF
jgi:hypothetical protein